LRYDTLKIFKNFDSSFQFFYFNEYNRCPNIDLWWKRKRQTHFFPKEKLLFFIYFSSHINYYVKLLTYGNKIPSVWLKEKESVVADFFLTTNDFDMGKVGMYVMVGNPT